MFDKIITFAKLRLCKKIIVAKILRLNCCYALKKQQKSKIKHNFLEFCSKNQHCLKTSATHRENVHFLGEKFLDFLSKQVFPY